ncbi:MAG: CRISPR-associated helicase Cas3' [Desulfobacteraceae bacterium]|nr:CRISPR-associated helicase Cas3' [Desulfobacteraceae bacterium]
MPPCAHRRLIRDVEGENVKPGQSKYIGVMHGKLTQYLAEFFEDTDNNPEAFQSRLAKIRDIHKQMVHPFKIVTPFQILKYCYGVKGFEKGFAELAGSMLVFDEIHAYDTQTFAQIVASLNWLKKHLGIRVMIMSATLPDFMLNELQNAIGSYKIVRAEDRLMEKFTRHCVRISVGTIFDQAPAIRQALDNGKRVIVVCNTVANAQNIFREFKDEFESVLIHSRFTVNDRLQKESILFEQGENIRLLVGTQAIEVSLDIDFDVMFTEPAPLDALIQRFGRINRKLEKGICPVYVCSKGGENDHYIYPSEIVEKTLQVSGNISEIKEKALQEMLDRVYPECPEKDKYDETKAGFAESLSRLKPFMRHKEEEDAFYEKFTGASVLPVKFQDTYEELIRGFEFIEAEKLLVSLHRNMFFKLRGKELIEKCPVVIEMKSFPYWLVRCKYDSQIGLLEKE